MFVHFVADKPVLVNRILLNVAKCRVIELLNIVKLKRTLDKIPDFYLSEVSSEIVNRAL